MPETNGSQRDPLKQIRDDINTHIGRMRKVEDPTAKATWLEMSRTLAPLLRQTVEFVDYLRQQIWKGFEELHGALDDFDERIEGLEEDALESQLTDDHATLFSETLAGSRLVIEEMLATGLQTSEGKTKLEELLARIIECQAIVDDIRLPPEGQGEEPEGDEGQEAGEQGDLEPVGEA
jgi:hypothetical protein